MIEVDLELFRSGLYILDFNPFPKGEGERMENWKKSNSLKRGKKNEEKICSGQKGRGGEIKQFWAKVYTPGLGFTEPWYSKNNRITYEYFTSGSIMNISVSRNRNLNSLYLQKEVYLKFNLPPFHILKENGYISQVAKIWRDKIPGDKKFYRRYKSKKASGLQFDSLSSSLDSFRKKECENCHFPL